MNDPLGLIGNAGRLQPPIAPKHGAGQMPPVEPPDGPTFGEALDAQVRRVNELQQDAQRAAEDVVTGKSDNLEGLISASEKADVAFRMLLQVRNRMMEAYDEVKQVRV